MTALSYIEASSGKDCLRAYDVGRHFHLDLGTLDPILGRWIARLSNGDGLCEIEVDGAVLERWARACIHDAAHLSRHPLSYDIIAWLKTGHGHTKDSAWRAAENAHYASQGTCSVAEAVATLCCYGERAAAEAVHCAASAFDHHRDMVRLDLERRIPGGALNVDPLTNTDPLIDAVAAAQRAHLLRAVWECHGNALSMRQRLELSRDLRHHGETDAAMAVVPINMRHQ